MQEMMLAFSESALADADILLYVTDVIENPEKNMDFLDKVKKMSIPVLLLINKIDESHFSIHPFGVSDKTDTSRLMASAAGRTSGNMDTWKDSVGELFLADPLNAGL